MHCLAHYLKTWFQDIPEVKRVDFLFPLVAQKDYINKNDVFDELYKKVSGLYDKIFSKKDITRQQIGELVKYYDQAIQLNENKYFIYLLDKNVEPFKKIKDLYKTLIFEVITLNKIKNGIPINKNIHKVNIYIHYLTYIVTDFFCTNFLCYVRFTLGCV